MADGHAGKEENRDGCHQLDDLFDEYLFEELCDPGSHDHT
jgi:hypothetical protein